MTRIFAVSLCLIACALLLSCQPAAPPTNLGESRSASTPTEPSQKISATDLEALSNRLVNQVAGVKEGDIVLISGGVRDAELLENLSTDVRKGGAFPLLTLNSDRL